MSNERNSGIIECLDRLKEVIDLGYWPGDDDLFTCFFSEEDLAYGFQGRNAFGYSGFNWSRTKQGYEYWNERVHPNFPLDPEDLEYLTGLYYKTLLGIDQGSTVP